MLKRVAIIYLLLAFLGSDVVVANCELPNCKPDSTKYEVDSFDDIVRHLSRKRVRYIYASRSTPEFGEEPVIDHKRIDMGRFYDTIGRRIDSLNLIDYSNDTVCIRSFTHHSTIYKTYKRLYCKGGLYELGDSITPIVYPEDYCGAERRAQDEAMRKKHYPDLDAVPLSYDWEMLHYRCFDEQRLFYNVGGDVGGFSMDIIRVIIKDHRIVYCDCWIW